MTTRAPLLAFLLLLSGVLAGCSSKTSGDGETPPSPTFAPNWAEAALPDDPDHDHNVADHHAGRSTPNFQVLGWDPLISDHFGATGGNHFCGDVQAAGDRQLAVVHGFNSEIAFVLMDVTDAAKPVKIGEFVLANVKTYDAVMVPGGRFVVLGTNPEDTAAPGPLAPAPARTQPLWRDACGREFRGPEQDLPVASGVVLVDIADPKSPKIADYVPEPVFGPHSVFATRIDGTAYVLASITNLAHQASYFRFFTVSELPTGGKLVEYGTYTAQYPAPTARTPLENGHVDGWIHKHPATNKLIAYLADWNGGLIIVEMKGPGQLQGLAEWSDFDPTKGREMTGQIHDALPMDVLWDGKHYTFAGQECGEKPSKRATCQILAFDTTDPAKPKPVARWTLPVDVRWGGFLMFSTHYIEVVDRTLFVTLYHGGVWAVDVGDLSQWNLPTIGVFLPTNVSPKPPPQNIRGVERESPQVLDVHALPNGNLVIWDGLSGVYTLRFDASAPAPPPAPWTKDGWKPPA